MRPYHIQIPTQIFFGRDIWKEAIRELTSVLNGNIMIVTTGRSLIRLGYIDELVGQLKQHTLMGNIIVFDNVSANPRLSEAKKGIKLAKEAKIDLVVAFGGGSAIDMAKAVSAGAVTDTAIEDYFYHGIEPPQNALPLLAIPTTAGTGSELSKAAILTDEEKCIKSGIRGSSLYPKAAIVDSVFTESVPFSTTMETGFDVLAHAIESYISKAASPYTQMLSEYTVESVRRALPRLIQDLKDIDARREMSYASMMMGINLGNASTCLPHRLQYPLGAFTDTSHGAGLAALYTSWIEYEYPYSHEKVERLMSILAGETIYGKRECVRVIRDFVTMLRLPTSLKIMKIDQTQLNDMA
ncbi:MAG: iron-containing alcohol dehydrogenase, partial [Lachnospiraceae bacterium]|nr:iron-containing alcohol dehydrogenase [Lachnospiraceae bacterium]